MSITLQEALDWAIEEVEQDTAPLTVDKPEGGWRIEGKVIYGLHGVNRYFIRDDEVTFSARHCHPITEHGAEVLVRAFNAGFTIE